MAFGFDVFFLFWSFEMLLISNKKSLMILTY